MKLLKFAGLIALTTAILTFVGCASSYYIIGSYTINFNDIEEYKHATPESGPSRDYTDSGIPYTGNSRTVFKEDDKGSMTIGINNYEDPMYTDNQDPREVLKSLMRPG